ncbi:hypothetical protein ColTof4_11505 [Colletotrichum tofieldiae]|nr:hypothetical protein ColTof4_11505 [Colletotrichum tofieldiae]
MVLCQGTEVSGFHWGVGHLITSEAQEEAPRPTSTRRQRREEQRVTSGAADGFKMKTFGGLQQSRTRDTQTDLNDQAMPDELPEWNAAERLETTDVYEGKQWLRIPPVSKCSYATRPSNETRDK